MEENILEKSNIGSNVLETKKETIIEDQEQQAREVETENNQAEIKVEKYGRMYSKEHIKETDDCKKGIIQEYGCTWQEYSENEEKDTYEKYLYGLGLSESDLENKKILDIGAGERLFASYCFKNKINKEVYSLEPSDLNNNLIEVELRKAIWSEQLEKEIDSKTISGIVEKMPLKDKTFDLIVSNCALPGFDGRYSREMSMKGRVSKSYDEIIRVMKNGSEARIFPFIPDQDEFRKPLTDATKEKLDEFRSREDISVRLEKVAPRDKDPEDKEQKDYFRIIIKKIDKTNIEKLDFMKN